MGYHYTIIYNLYNDGYKNHGDNHLTIELPMISGLRQTTPASVVIVETLAIVSNVSFLDLVPWHGWIFFPPLVNTQKTSKNDGRSQFLIGKSSISMGHVQ